MGAFDQEGMPFGVLMFQKTDRLEPMYTIDRLCHILQISRTTFYRHRKDGLIPEAFMIGSRPRWSASVVQKLIENAPLANR